MDAALSSMRFIVVGQARSGAGVVQSALCAAPFTVCHADLLHTDLKRRRVAAGDYFSRPLVFAEALHVPQSYLAQYVFDNSQYGEDRVGIRLDYAFMQRWEFAEALEDYCHEGDFCLVHVQRNPVACFVSLAQARRGGRWVLMRSEPQAGNDAMPVSIDAEALTAFVREHLAIHGRVERSCDDKLSIQYADLRDRYNETMLRICRFLECPKMAAAPLAAYRRVSRQPIAGRVANWTRLLYDVPKDIRDQMLAPDCQ